MNTYRITPTRKVDTAELIRILDEKGLPHKSVQDGKAQIVTMGVDGEFTLRRPSGGFLFSKATVTLKFEDPELKGALSDWMDVCGLDAPEDFFHSHSKPSPTVLNRIKATWGIDLSRLEAVPIKLEANILVFLLTADADKLLLEQLATRPHRGLQDGEYIKSKVFEVDASDDPFDTTVYRWDSNSTTCIAVRNSASIQTFLSLWRLTEDGDITTNIEEMPNT